MSGTAINIEFRFLQLDKMQAIILTREVQGAHYQPHAVKPYFIGSVPLIKESMDDINHFFIRQKVVETECDILISSQQAVDRHEVKVPPIVNRMLKDIDCPLTLSFSLNQG